MIKSAASAASPVASIGKRPVLAIRILGHRPGAPQAVGEAALAADLITASKSFMGGALAADLIMAVPKSTKKVSKDVRFEPVMM